MPVMPIVRLFFPCAHADYGEDGIGIYLVDPIEALVFPKVSDVDYALGPMYFYALLKEGLGTFFLRVEVRNERGKRFAASRPIAVDFNRNIRDVVQQVVFVLQGLKIKEHGMLRFDLFANEVSIAHWDMKVLSLGDWS